MVSYGFKHKTEAFAILKLGIPFLISFSLTPGLREQTHAADEVDSGPKLDALSRRNLPRAGVVLRFSEAQVAQFGRFQFLRKADVALCARIPEWARSQPDGRDEFIGMCLDRSARYGLRSERSVLAYTFTAIWRGQMFEKSSPLLLRLLNSPLPEARKTHAMLAWHDDQFDHYASQASGDAAIRRSLELTIPWGRR